MDGFVESGVLSDERWSQKFGELGFGGRFEMVTPTGRTTGVGLPVLSLRSPVSAWRVIFVIAICTTGSVSLIFWFMIEGATAQISSIVGSIAQTAIEQHEGLGCLRDPQRWGMTTSLGARIYAYDIRDLASVNPKAPPLSPEIQGLLKRLRARAYKPEEHHGTPPLLRRRSLLLNRGGVYFFRLAEHGPCSLLMVRWVPDSNRRFWGLVRVGVIFFGGLLLSLLLGFFLIVKPLLWRIEALAALAREVGRERAVLESEGPPVDELGLIRKSLALAHQRILEDKERLSAQSLALSRHMADIAHDLRTPIASLQLHLERMSQGHHEEIPEALADVVYLENLTNNLGFSARLQSELMQPFTEGTCDLNEVVTRIAGRFRLLAQEQEIALDFACPDQSPQVFGQSLLYERLLSNLVHNSIRYAPTGGHIAILLEVEKSRFSLQVLDDGPGVPPKDLPSLQDRAWRAEDARQREPTGQGLGLAITAEICHLLGLDIEFQAIEPQGLHVSIRGALSMEEKKDPSSL